MACIGQSDTFFRHQGSVGTLKEASTGLEATTLPAATVVRKLVFLSSDQFLAETVLDLIDNKVAAAVAILLPNITVMSSAQKDVGCLRLLFHFISTSTHHPP